MKPNLEIHTPSEISDDEVQIVEESFADTFDVTIHKSLKRFSEGDLPLVISFAIGVLSSITAAGIIFCVKQFFAKLPPDKVKSANVHIKVQQKQVVIGQNKILIINHSSQPVPTEKFYHSLEKAFENLEDDEP